jgi:eukaryotic-like serine/threonine-protein kinase
VAGKRILAGRYELLAEIGSGGMGTVYRARDRRTRTVVAVKLLHPHLAQDRHYVERFRREAQIARTLDSAHIVKVLDVGDHDGQPFIVMEYVPGATLREALEARRRFSSKEALALCVQIVEALQEAYRKGVVHRDIKPQNVILTAEGLAKVADFGVAKAEELSTITLAGSFFGTLQYAAPERFEGAGDIRSDIYSVGIILYQMLTGTVPFAADSALALIRLHSEQPPAPLSQHVPDIPDDVQALVSRCLAKSPAGRFQSPDALATAISSLLPAADAKAALARISLPKRRGGLQQAAGGHRAAWEGERLVRALWSSSSQGSASGPPGRSEVGDRRHRKGRHHRRPRPHRPAVPLRRAMSVSPATTGSRT